MVSLRRRRLLGLCSGRKSFLIPVLDSINDGTIPGSASGTAAVGMHLIASEDVKQLRERILGKVSLGTSDVQGSSLSTEQRIKQASESAATISSYSGESIKRRKPHRRKPNQNHEPCLMRGVYFKNMKWQAAIKVDKKQIHLGTVGSQEEAAHLFDRAAFMCGREPNFELPEEEKQELRKFSWEEFLAMTQSAITKKQKRGGRLQKKTELSSHNSDQYEGKGASSTGEDE